MRWILFPIFCVAAWAVAPWSGPSAAPGTGRDPQRRNGPLEQRALAGFIDQAFAEAWKAEGLTPVAPATDAAWLRRLSIDVRGAIPLATEVAEFLNDVRPDRRESKIEEYLADRAFAVNLSYQWTNLLLSSSGKDGERTSMWLRPWMERQLAEGISFSDLTRELVASSDSKHRPDSIAYCLTYRDSIETLSGLTARAFLGLQIQCAQCHDHPHDKWTRGQFNAFTGFFLDMRGDFNVASRAAGGVQFRVIDRTPEWDLEDRLQTLVQRTTAGASASPVAAPPAPPASMDGTMSGDMQASMQQIVDAAPPLHVTDVAPLRELIGLCRRTPAGQSPLREYEGDPQKLEQYMEVLPSSARDLVKRYLERRELFSQPAFLDGTPYQPKEKVTKRAALAEWIVAPENPWYGRAIANRVLAHFLGKGLVEPVDDLSASTDQVLPDLLARIAQEFLAHDTDPRFLVGAIVRTQAYALGNSLCEDAAERKRAERWYAAHPMRPFTAEQALHSMQRAMALTPADEGDSPTYEGEIERKRLLRPLRNSFRTDAADGDGFAASIPQALLLMNSRHTNKSTTLRRTPAAAAFNDASRPDAERLRDVFHMVLGRPPSEQETAQLASFLARDADSPQGDPFADVVWALLNSAEFHTNY